MELNTRVPSIAQVTVYADIQDEELLRCLSTAATALCETAVIRTVPLMDAEDPLAFLKLWEKERDDVWSYVNCDVPIMQRFECFVTDSKNRKDGAVAYALYYRQMPVLSLAAAVSGVEEVGAEVSDDWITAVLYNTVASLNCSFPANALVTFFTFPKLWGKLVAVEGDCAALVLEQCQLLRDCMRSEWSVPVQLVGASGCDLAGLDGDEVGLRVTEEEEEEALYAPLIADLLNTPEFQCIREGDPQLHGALSALNRHHNLRLLRYRLQRGVNIIICRPLSSVFEELVRSCARKELPMVKVRESLAGVVKSVQHFEFHWLGLPRPEVVLICTRDHTNMSTSVAPAMGTVTSSLRWTACLFDEGHSHVVDTLSGWRVVMVEDVAGDEGETLGRLHGGVLDAVRPVFAPDSCQEHGNGEGKKRDDCRIR